MKHFKIKLSLNFEIKIPDFVLAYIPFFIGPSISKDNNCTSNCISKNLTCSSEFTEVSIESLNCTKPSDTTLYKWYEEYHPSYNQDSQICEGFKQTDTQKACDKVNTSSSNILRICFCLRRGRSVRFTSFFL